VQGWHITRKLLVLSQQKNIRQAIVNDFALELSFFIAFNSFFIIRLQIIFSHKYFLI
jgi:hypothetical protein